MFPENCTSCMPYGRTLRTIAFCSAAVITLFSAILNNDIFSDVVMTQFVKLGTDKYIIPNMNAYVPSTDQTRVAALGLCTSRGTIHRLMYKWRCPNANQTVGIWGPDNMCRCLSNFNLPCSDNAASLRDAEEVEKTCYRNVVPVYSQVHAGSIRGYWNFYIGLFLIHISILFSMKGIEYPMDEGEGKNTNGGSYVTADLVNPPPQDPIYTQGGHPLVRIVDGDANHRPHEGRGHQGKKHKQGRVKFSSNDSKLGGAFDWAGDVDEHDDGYMQVGVPFTDNQWNTAVYIFWDFLVFVLSATVFILTLFIISNTNEFVQYKMGTSSTVLYTWSATIAITTFLVTLLPRLSQLMRRNTERDIPYRPTLPKLENYLYTCVLQDLNYITGFVLVVSTFSAQSGVHDDNTLFVDIACVVFLGFLQHLSHVTMLMKEEAVGLCEDPMDRLYNAKEGQGEKIRSYAYESQVMDRIFQFFSSTRALIFGLMGITAYIFLFRMAPTVFVSNSVADWNSNAKFLTVLYYISPSILYDLYYEFVHFNHMKRYQRHLEYFGPNLWRIWGGIAFIFVSCIMTFQGYSGDENRLYERDLFLGGIKSNSM